jgi:hypothetical protein
MERVSVVTGLRLEPSVAAREKRLRALLGDRAETEDALQDVVRDAQLLGSLQLSGLEFNWLEVRTRREGAPLPVTRLRAAQRLLPVEAALSRSTLLAWHREVTGAPEGFRRSERTRPAGPAPAPAAFVEGRLAILEQWLASEGGGELSPTGAAALAFARILEVAPFDDGNGRVARLAASHLMVRGGRRPPILVKGDAPRIEAALARAFALDTTPLVSLLEEASHRGMDVLIQTLEQEKAAPPGSEERP